MLILSFTSVGLEFWSVKHSLMLKMFKLIILKTMKLLGEIYSNW